MYTFKVKLENKHAITAPKCENFENRSSYDYYNDNSSRESADEVLMHNEQSL